MIDSEITSAFGSTLRRFRLAAVLTQEALAERARVSPDTISSLERGARRAPYRQTVRLLAAALGLSEAQHAELALAAQHARGPRRANPLGELHLPLYATKFFGRSIERAGIRELFRRSRLVTICGPGGVGKTRLAIELGRSLSSHFRDGVCFVRLASVVDPAFVSTRIAEAAQIAVNGPASLDSLVAALASRELLLIIDNCEHLVEECARAVEAIVQRCPHIKTLTTSREPLALDGESLLRLEPLDAEGAAIELFVDRASASAEAPLLPAHAVSAIVRSVDGIPLAIELAAAMARMHPLEDIEAAFRAGSFLTSANRRTAIAHQQTMHATIAWSYDLLSPRQQDVLRTLAYPAAPVTRDAAIALCGPEAESVLRRLVEVSLVVEERETGRLRIHETTRQFAASLSGAHEKSETATHFGAFLAERLRVAGEQYWQRSSYAAFAPLRSDLDNVRQAFAWALERGDRSLALDLAGAPDYWTIFGRAVEGLTWLTRVRDELGTGNDDLDDGDPRSVLLHFGITFCALQSGHPRDAAASQQRAAALAARHGNVVIGGRVHVTQGHLLLGRGELADSAASFERASDRFTEIDDATGISRALSFLAMTQIELDRLDDAEASLERVKHLHDTLPECFDRADRGIVETFSSEILRLRGDDVGALRLARSAFDQFGAIRTSVFLRSLHQLLDDLIATNDFDEAQNIAARELLQLYECGFNADFALVLERCALIAALQGNAPRGAFLYGFANAMLATIARGRSRFDRDIDTRLRAVLSQSLNLVELTDAMRCGALATSAEAIAAAIPSAIR